MNCSTFSRCRGQSFQVRRRRGEDGERRSRRGECLQWIAGFRVLQPDGVERFRQRGIAVRAGDNLSEGPPISRGMIHEVEKKLSRDDALVEFLGDDELAQQQQTVGDGHFDEGGVFQLLVTLHQRLGAAGGFAIGIAIDNLVRGPGEKVLLRQDGAGRGARSPRRTPCVLR